MRVAGSVCVALCCTTNTLPPRLEHAQADKKTMTGSASVTGGNGKTAQIVGPNWFSGMLTMHVIDGALSPAPAGKKIHKAAAAAAAPVAPVAAAVAAPKGRRMLQRMMQQYTGLATSIGINSAQAAIQQAVSSNSRYGTMAATDANQALTYSVGECQAGALPQHMYVRMPMYELGVRIHPNLPPTIPHSLPHYSRLHLQRWVGGGVGVGRLQLVTCLSSLSVDGVARNQSVSTGGCAEHASNAISPSSPCRLLQQCVGTL